VHHPTLWRLLRQPTTSRVDLIENGCIKSAHHYINRRRPFTHFTAQTDHHSVRSLCSKSVQYSVLSHQRQSQQQQQQQLYSERSKHVTSSSPTFKVGLFANVFFSAGIDRYELMNFLPFSISEVWTVKMTQNVCTRHNTGQWFIVTIAMH